MRIFPFPFFVAASLLGAPVAASAGEVYISKISTAGSAAHEWIEVANSGASPVDLTAWKFWEAQTNHGLKAAQGGLTVAPGGRAIVAEDAATFLSDHPSSTMQVIDSAWSSLADDGEEIGLRDASGTLYETFIYQATGGGAISRDGADSIDWCPLPDQGSAGLESSCVTDAAPEPEPQPEPEPPVETVPEPTPEPAVPTDQEPIQTPATETTEPTLLLSEIFPAPPSGGKEWVELWNPGTDAVAADSCEVRDATGKIAAQSDPVPAGSYVTVELSSAKLNNDGDDVSVVCGGVTTDAVTYADATAPESGQSLARSSLPDGAWQLTTAPTPGSANSIVTPAVEPPKTSSNRTATRKHEAGRVLVNEIFPGTNGSAWIEIANPESRAISLTGWTLAVGTDAPVALKGTLASDAHLLVDYLNGPIAGASGIVFLIDAQGYTIDQVVWGSGDNTREDNAPAIAADGSSIARKYDALQTENDDLDFVLTDTPTPGSANRAASTDATTGNLVLNEVLPDPEGPDADGEFVEIRNAGDSPADLEGWSVSIGGHTPKRLPSIKLATGAVVAVRRETLRLSLPNSGGTIALKNPAGTDVDSMTYGKLGAGISMAMDEEGAWSETRVPTPGETNLILQPNDPPKAILSVETPESEGGDYIFDAGDSHDPDGPLSSLLWDFGDGSNSAATTTAHAFAQAGRYETRLTVFDPAGASSTATRILRVPVKYSAAAMSETGADPERKAAGTKKTVVKKAAASTKAKKAIVSVTGVALSPSGALGSRLVPLKTPDGNILIELPKTTDRVDSGDTVSASGVAGTRNNKPVIKTSSFAKVQGDAPSSETIDDLDDIELLPEYSLVTVEGAVVEKTTASLLLSGTGEIKVVLPRAGKRGSYTVGEVVSATGLSRKNADGTTDLVTRTIDDLKVKTEAPIAQTKGSGRPDPISPIGAGAAGTASGVLATAGWGATTGLRKRLMDSITAFRSAGAA